jgi:hypothetical protein
MKLYISDLAAYLLLLFYLPLALGALWKLARWHGLSGWRKGSALLVGVLLAYAIPLGDVTLNSITMERVCQRAGLHVYRKVVVDGYLDRHNLPANIDAYGYRFVEIPQSRLQRDRFVTEDKAYVRYERDPDGRVVRHEVEVPISEYEVLRDHVSPVPNERLRSQVHTYVRNRVTGEVLGEQFSFHPMHGWIDRLTLNRWFGGSLAGCSGHEVAARSEELSDGMPPPPQRHKGQRLSISDYPFPQNVLLPSNSFGKDAKP